MHRTIRSSLQIPVQWLLTFLHSNYKIAPNTYGLSDY